MASSNDTIDVDGDLKTQWLKASAEFAKDCRGEKLDQKPNPEQTLAMISAQKDKDDKESAKRKKYKNCVANTIVCLQAIGGILSQAASMFFGPSDMCLNAVSFFVRAATAYNKIFSDLDSLWETISNALDRFRIYMENQSIIDVGMKKIANQILIQFVDVCRLSRKILTRNILKQAAQMAKTAFFKSDAGVGDAIQALASLITKETQTRDTYGYVAIKDTQKNVTEGFEQTNQGLSQANVGITELRGILSKDDRKRQLYDIQEKLGKPTSTGQRDELGKYTQSAVSQTGDWLVNHGGYQSWAEKDTVEQPIIFLAGNEGCGKTYLTSAIIQGLLKRFPQGKEDMNQISVVYYYFRKVESTKRDSQDQYCSIHTALRTMAYQVAENDPIYRKNVVGLENNDVISTSDILELWNMLFDEQIENAAKLYLIIDGTHELEDRQLAELGKVLSTVASQSSRNYSVRAMIAARPDNVKMLSKELGNTALSIDVAASNGEDILKFVRKELDCMPLLKHFDALRGEICTSLIEIAKGTFGHIGLLLQQIRNKRRQDEIKELLERAKQGSFHDSIADVIEEGNQKLSDMDIDDLNQLLEWTMSGDYPYTLNALEAILHIRRESLYLVPLYDRLKAEFSGFFTISPDRNEPGAMVTLISDQIREHFQRSSGPEEGDTQLPQNKISKMEVGIIQRFLKNLCDDALYQKFEFDQFFKQKTGATSRIHVDTEEMHGNVALDCLKILSSETSDATDPIVPWACWILADRLESADLSYLGPKLKGEVGKRLVPLFADDEPVTLWHTFDNGRQWLVSEGMEDAMLKWFRDTAAMKNISVDERAWVDSIKSNSDKEQRDFLENVAKAAAEAWLVGDEGDETDFASMVQSYRFVRGYCKKIEHKKNPSIPRLTDSGYYEANPDEDIDGLLVWAKEQSGITELAYFSYYRVAKIYHLNRQYEKAEASFQGAISLQGDDAYHARYGLAELYADADIKQFPLAVDTMSIIVQRLRKLPTPSEEEQERLKASLVQIATWKKRLFLYDDAMSIYQELLRKDAKDYVIICEVLSLLADRNDLKEILDYLNDLQSQADEDTANDRLTQLLLARADDETTHDIISRTAREFRYPSSIRESYERAIRIAEKNAEDAEVEPSAETVLYLKHSLAKSLHRHTSQAETLKAIKLWEEITANEVPYSSFWSVIRPLRTASCRICLHYLAEARAAGTDSSTAEQCIGKVRNFVEGLSSEREILLEEYEMKTLLGYHFAVVGQKEQAKQQLRSIIEVGIGLLSDDDDENDYLGYMKLADGFMRFQDDENTLAALSLIGPDKNLPPVATNGEFSQHDDVAKPAPNGSSVSKAEPMPDEEELAPDSHISTTNPEQEPDLPIRPLLKHTSTLNITKKPTEKPSGPLNMWCDCGRDACEGKYSFPDDYYMCRQCLDVLFAPECFQLLREDKLRRHVCDKTHDFFYVPPWDYERVNMVGKREVEVGGRVMKIEEWLDGIREEWGIKS